jgi:hypothetical protein
MAAVVTELSNTNTPVAISEDIILVNTNDVTSLTVTPTLVKAIYSATLLPLNAAAAAAGATTYITGPAAGNLYGSASLVINSAVACLFQLVVRGTTA